MNGSELATFCEELNGGASIGETLLFQHINVAKALVEHERPWMILRYTDTSKTVTASTNGWQTAIDISTIARFSRFYGDCPIKNFDGNHRIDYYRQVPMQKRLEFKEAPFTFIHDVANEDIYLNGTVAAGTLWIEHIKDSPEIENDDASEWVFPSWSHALLGFLAVAMHKGGIDYDEVNARQLVQNNADAMRLFQRLVSWDAELQLGAQEQHDPSTAHDGSPRPNAINM
ncbi:MAG: hypothetical protein AB7G08_32635 [Hyphomicrobiaceae bacterium]